MATRTVTETRDLLDPGLVNLADLVTPASRYSFVFDGTAQTLDHMLVTDKPLTITLSTETVSLLMESPFDKLEFRAAAAQKLDLTAERPATLTVNQVGEYRFVAGKFQTLFYEGKPSFIGSATKDVVK